MFRRVKEYIRFYLKADTLYGVHSPAVYKLMKHCFDDGKHYYATSRLVHLREKYAQDHREIDILDKGAGSKYTGSSRRTISSIVKTSSSDPAKCKILFNLSRYFRPRHILELGTNLGLGAAHIFAGNENAIMHTVESDPSLYNLARSLFNEMSYGNIHCFNKSFSSYLEHNAEYLSKVDFIYLDGHHRYDATMGYYNLLRNNVRKRIIVIDDIYWSAGMTRAWREIRSEMTYGASIDLFKMGIIFLDPVLEYPVHHSLVKFKYKPWKIGLGAWF